ncbi:MAG: hypothetical protein H0V29_04035 [Thermoleophilaceae bacterium]|nr:hypothetical protein [Thermoleophilaceae bacterium]
MEGDRDRWREQAQALEHLQREVESLRKPAGPDPEVAGLKAEVEALRRPDPEVERLRGEIEELRADREERPALDELRQEIEQLKTAEPPAPARAPDQPSRTTKEKARVNASATGRFVASALIIAAFMAVPLLAVHRTSCGSKAAPTYEWSVGLPGAEPDEGCFERQNGAQVIADSFS